MCIGRIILRENTERNSLAKPLVRELRDSVKEWLLEMFMFTTGVFSFFYTEFQCRSK